MALTSKFTATPDERESLRQMGEAAAIERLRIPRATLARICGGLSVREGTLALFRMRLAEFSRTSSEPSSAA